MTAIRLSTTIARALRPRCYARHVHHVHRFHHAGRSLPGLLCTAALLAASAGTAAADARATGISSSGTSRAGVSDGISTETLVKSTAAWDQTGYTTYPAGIPEPTLVRITLAPNTWLAWHTHPMPAIGYVTSGQLMVERADNGVQRSFAAGQTIMELVDVPHRGWTGDTGAELLVFYARSVQQPLSVAYPDAKNLAEDDSVKDSVTTTPRN